MTEGKGKSRKGEEEEDRKVLHARNEITGKGRNNSTT